MYSTFFNRRYPRLLCTCIAANLFGCAAQLPPTGLQSIQILAEVNANQINATALDLVFVYDANILSLLPKNGTDWFNQKAALSAGFATAIDVISLQITPASSVQLPDNPAFPARYKKAIGVYSYANYVNPAGQPVANLTPYGNVQIRLTPDTVNVSGQAPAGFFGKLFGK